MLLLDHGPGREVAASLPRRGVSGYSATRVLGREETMKDFGLQAPCLTYAPDARIDYSCGTSATARNARAQLRRSSLDPGGGTTAKLFSEWRRARETEVARTRFDYGYSYGTHLIGRKHLWFSALPHLLPRSLLRLLLPALRRRGAATGPLSLCNCTLPIDNYHCALNRRQVGATDVYSLICCFFP